MAKDETLWSGIKFTLLLSFSVLLVYVILCKYITPIPESGTERLVTEIDNSEMVLSVQKQMVDKVNAIKAEVDSVDFSIQQMQRTGDLKARISQLKDVYRKSNSNPQYIFSVQAYNTLQGYFDTKESLNFTVSDNKLIETDLEKVKANI